MKHNNVKIMPLGGQAEVGNEYVQYRSKRKDFHH